MQSNLSFPVLKSPSKDQPIAKIPYLGVAVDMRKVIVISVALFVCWGLSTQLGRFVTLSVVRVLVLCVPIMAIAVVAAFKKHEGRYLEFWALKRLIRFFAVDTLKWRRKEPGRPQTFRDSIQERIPTERIVWDMIRCKDGTYVTVGEIEPVKLSLSSEAEQMRVWAGMVRLYNRVDFPFTEVTRAKPGDLSRYIRLFRETAAREARTAGKRFESFSRQHASYLETVVKKHEVFERQAYVILHYKPPGAGSQDTRPWWAFWRAERATPKNAAELQEEAEQAYEVLAARAEILADGIHNIGARFRALKDLALLEFLQGQTAGEDPMPGEPPRFYEPLTLFHGPYEKLSPRKLTAVVNAMEERRRAAPPAIGIGNLIVNQIAPDAVRIHPDYLRVGPRFHATMFVTEYPEKVTFGAMQDLLTLPGRIKVVKHIRPVPQEEAVNRIGTHFASLSAASETAADGNVVVENQRKISMNSAGEGMDELQSGKQGLVDLTFSIHCEANSKAELFALCEKAQSRLRQHRIKAMLAREEAWEGFISGLPAGASFLNPRYADHGMLTYPLAALFTFGSYQLNHERGIVWGVNPDEGAPVVLDNRKLKNYNQVVMGTSGGGKSQTIKMESTRLRQRGHRVVVIDPVGDSKYDRVARALGGEYLVFGVGTDHKFNPFDLRDNYLDLRLVASSNTDRDPEKARQKARAAAFDGKISALIALVGVMAGGGLDPDEEGFVQDLLVGVYADKDITHDPATHSFPPPIFPDFFAKLEGIPGLEGLRRRLRPWIDGPYRTVFDAQTNVDLDNKFLVLQLHGLKKGSRAKGAVMLAVLDFLNGRLSDPNEPSNCFVDEFWSLLRDPMAAEFCEEMWRSGRARNNAMIAITQNVIEFTGSDSGQLILELSATHLILQQGKKTAEALTEYYGLSETQRDDLQSFPQGHGLLIVEDRRIKVNVLCSDFEMMLFNTDPELEPYYEQQRLEAKKRRQELQVKKRRALPAAEKAQTRPQPALEGGGNARDAAPRKQKKIAPPRRPERQTTPRQSAPEQNTSRQEAPPAGRASSEDRTRPIPAAPSAPRSVPPVRAHSEKTRVHPAPAERLPAEASAVNGRGPGEEREGVLSLPRGRRQPARIFAVVGPTNGPVAYNLAGMLATLGKSSDVRVLFVDADGDVSERVFSLLLKPQHALPPDDLTVGGEGLDLGAYMAHDPASGLRVMRMVSNPHLPASGLAGILCEVFDLIVVPCAGSGYAQRWLLLADRVVATAAEPRALSDIVTTTEDLRGRNGTLLAPIGQVRLEDDGLSGHRAFGLPPDDELSAYAAEVKGGFTALKHDRVGQALTPLLRELLNAKREHEEVQRTR